VNDYKEKPLMISDMVLADYIAVDSTGTRVYVPSVLANFSEDQEKLFLLYEIYDRTGRDSVQVELTIRDANDEALRTLKRFKRLTGTRTDDAIEIPRGELKTGRYRLELTIGKGENAIRKRRDFSVHWIGMPVFARNIDMATEQMKYIASRKQMREIKKAEGAEKERLFREFWDSKDPTEQSPTNELMDEYYRRVAFANRSFTTFREGWKTDRGMVYIILGPPDEIVRRPFNRSNKPYVVWAYYRYNREFIFMDDTGYGEYRLMSPFWDLVNRIQ
jgi:GWxTD domain-containing protein